jgi:4-amino-4-deoxy-L-arabinose transferase-like glycosyltransferase
MNEGIQIAQRGAIVVSDPVVASMPAFARPLFFPLTGRTDYDSLRFMGFFVQDLEKGTVVGQFPHLFPASIAIGYGIDGLTGARRTVGVWAILGLLSVYFAAARLAGRAVAAAAAGLLALNIITVWFAGC